VRDPNESSLQNQNHLEATPRVGFSIGPVETADFADGEFGTAGIDFPGIIGSGGSNATATLSVNYAGPVWFGPWFTGKILHNTAVHRIQSEISGDDIYIEDEVNLLLEYQIQLNDISNFTEQKFFVIDPSYAFQSRVEHNGFPFGGAIAAAFGGRSTLPYLQGPPMGLVGKEISSSFRLATVTLTSATACPPSSTTTPVIDPNSAA